MRALIAAMLSLALSSCTIPRSMAADTGEFTEPGAAEWFKQSKQQFCCTQSDGHRGVIRSVGKGYEAYIEGQWWPVPQEAIVKDIISPFSTPVIWYRGEPPSIRCLILNIGI